MYTLEKNNIYPLCILCMLMSRIIPLLTLTLIHTWYEESTAQFMSCAKNYCEYVNNNIILNTPLQKK